MADADQLLEQANPTEESLNRRLTRLDSRIKNQFDLIGSRTGWLLASQAFLLAAFGAILNKPEADFSSDLILIRSASFIALPIAGIICCILIRQSIGAAYMAVSLLKAQRMSLLAVVCKRHGYENTELPSEITVKGDRPPKILPDVMLAIWVVMLVLLSVSLTHSLGPVFSAK